MTITRGERKIVPTDATSAVLKSMSLNLLLENEDDPVIWRGPLIANAVKQFWTDVIWGDLDFLLIDLPPGTGDAPLTVMQSLPVDGLVIVVQIPYLGSLPLDYKLAELCDSGSIEMYDSDGIKGMGEWVKDLERLKKK
jgi:Mrp family chromosome partitioning ATPase